MENSSQKAINANETQGIGQTSSDPLLSVGVWARDYHWRHTSSEVKGQWGLLLPPCLFVTAVQQTRDSCPLSWLKHSCEGVIWMCRPSFNNSSCPMLWFSMMSPPTELDGGCYACFSLLQQTSSSSSRRDLIVLLQSHVQSPSRFSNVDWPGRREGACPLCGWNDWSMFAESLTLEWTPRSMLTSVKDTLPPGKQPV